MFQQLLAFHLALYYNISSILAVHILRCSMDARQHRVAAQVFFVEYRHFSPTHDEIILLKGSHKCAVALVMV